LERHPLLPIGLKLILRSIYNEECVCEYPSTQL